MLQTRTKKPINLAKVASNFSYEDFAAMRDEWLNNGRLIWYMYGNIEQFDALNIVNYCNNSLNTR